MQLNKFKVGDKIKIVKFPRYWFRESLFDFLKDKHGIINEINDREYISWWKHDNSEYVNLVHIHISDMDCLQKLTNKKYKI